MRDYRSLMASWVKSAEPTAKKYNVPTWRLVIDRVWSSLVYKTEGELDYSFFDFYRLNPLERRNFYTYKKFSKTCKWFFTPEMFKEVDSKKGFVNNYREYLGREVILLPCGEEKLLSFAQKYGRIFVKENNALGGRGVFLCKYEELSSDAGLLKKYSAVDGVAEEPIKQHPALEALNHRSISSVRITTMVEKTGNIKILGAILKVSMSDAFVDNLSSGAYAFEIDLEEGIVVGRGQSYTNDRIIRSQTGAMVTGLQIPYWSELIDTVTSAAKKFPEARMVGWDVAIGVERPLIVEANASTDPRTLQFGYNGCWRYLRSQR